jgi:transcriptional regulator with XRE-family HTH domain
MMKIETKNSVFHHYYFLIYARKQKKIKQADLGKLVGTSGDIIGKYERGENIPSIEVAAKIADALGVTLDYLVKEGEYQQIDNATLKRLKEIEKLDPGTKTKVFDIIDTYLRDFKTRQAYMA